MRFVFATVLCLSFTAAAREPRSADAAKAAKLKEVEERRAARSEKPEAGGRTATVEKQRRADELQRQREGKRR